MENARHIEEEKMRSKLKNETGLNHPEIPEEWAKSISVGINAICRFVNSLVEQIIASSGRRICFLAFDGFLGVEWQKFISAMKKSLVEAGFNTETINVVSYYKSPSENEEIINPYLTGDPFFGRIFDGHLEDFLDTNNIDALKDKLKSYESKKAASLVSSPQAVICYGCGAANNFLREFYDFVFYVDITREEFVKRIQKNEFGFLRSQEISEGMSQAADIGLPVYLFKLSTYVYYPVLERYKKYLLPYVDYYVDGNISNELKLVPRDTFDGILSILAQYPIRLKPLYIPSPWGGQWIKKIRKLPKSMVNCAWSFEAVAPEMSLKIAVGDTFLEIPFLTLMLRESVKLMGYSAVKRFQNFFPIRVHYDDGIDGGNMAIQVHPPASYVKEHFNEQIGQDESYYVVFTGSGSKVFLGLKEETDEEEFYEAVRKSEIQGVPLDYEKYVNSIPSKVGDLFLIPAGTVHASGQNEVVLEIGNSYGYTFHIYDYLRPDLHGKLRPIHSLHAFQVMKFHRRASWVNQHLKQRPQLVRSGGDWAEYLLGKLEEIFYVVHRLEFTTKINDDTKGKFRILTLVEGDRMIVQSKEHPERKFGLNFSETVIVPACFGKYSILNLGHSACKVIKVLLK